MLTPILMPTTALACYSALAAGILMFPAIEAWLLSTFIGHITLCMVVSLCLYGLIEGFSQHRAYLMGMTLSLHCVYHPPCYPSTLYYKRR